MHRIPLAALDRIAKVASKLHKREQLFLIGIFVNPVQERHLHPMKMLRHRLIGRKHKFLDNLLRN
ncbi:hypothetical protein D3C79_1068280 [compost metagenome]